MLHSYFPDISIYKDNQEGGFSRPAFAVYVPNNYTNYQLFSHALKKTMVIIKFYPEKVTAGSSSSDDLRSQAYLMGEALEDIFMDKPLPDHVGNVRWTVTDYDQTLNFKFNISYRVKRVPDEDEPTDYMRTLKRMVYIKNGNRKNN